MRHLLFGATGALLLVLGLACTTGPTPTPAPPTATPVPTATPTPKVEAKEAPAALKGAQESMNKVTSLKMKGQITFTYVGTPVPGMPTGPQNFLMEVSGKNSRLVMGDTEIVVVDNVTYIKSDKDTPWQKLPAAAGEEVGPEPPGEFLSNLSNPVGSGIEPCPRGGICQVLTAEEISAGGKITYKMWIGATDGRIYKYEISETSPEGKTEGTFEAYDYDVPIAIKAPIP